MELLTVFSVISLNSTRQALCGSMPRMVARCQEMASPSRSGSVARMMDLAPLASLRMRSRTSPRPRIVIYFGSKPCSTSTPSWDLGRSRTCPLEASTL